MSAHIIEDKNYDYILSAVLKASSSDKFPLGDKWITVKSGNFYFPADCRPNVELIGNMLKQQNYDSVNARYSENDPMDWPYKFRAMYETKIITALKLLDCYEYQACETADFDKSDAARFVNFARRILIARLPGYDEAPWGLKAA